MENWEILINGTTGGVDFSSVVFSSCYKFISQFNYSICIISTCKVPDNQKQFKLHMEMLRNVSLVTCFISSVPPTQPLEEAKLQDDKTTFPLRKQ